MNGFVRALYNYSSDISIGGKDLSGFTLENARLEARKSLDVVVQAVEDKPELRDELADFVDELGAAATDENERRWRASRRRAAHR